MATRATPPTLEALRQRLTYDPETGAFRDKSGKALGTVARGGYVVIRVQGRLQYAHRLAWIWVHGEPPAGDIDHANGVRTDNRIANLRSANRSENLANRRTANAAGFKGVNVHRDLSRASRYGASITKNGKRTFLGWHKTAEEAGAAYARAAKEIHGPFAKW
ncbi:HNH endonuclease signature motif containing protein [Achromobacter xylosoxidans]|uniref:HNH endonuclease signature motif containing protein n=1 Tax=Alcaligenes xylosoxydans xylosoxydans TaxID=85698 RepID=UPI0009E92D18|nr:HNH endonuclease signature motif containing protein [Achromobacter xylosoxidans]